MTATLTSWRLTMFLWAFVSAIPARPASAQSLSRVFTGSDLFSLEIAADPEISPDGRTIAYVRKSNDIMTDKAHSTISAARVSAILAGFDRYRARGQ